MRLLLPVLFIALTAFAEEPSQLPQAAPVPDNLSIPARFSKAVDTSKCKAGDRIEMKTLEPVLMVNGLVMPAKAKLSGKVVAAASRHGEKPSWMLLLVDRAEWKEHSIPLHAFITSQITMKAQVPGEEDESFENALKLADLMSQRRYGRQAQTNPGGETLSRTRPPLDSTVEAHAEQQLSYRPSGDIRIFRDRHGRVFLLSQKAHLKVPSGTMFMLRNQPVTQITQAQSANSTDNVH